MKHVEDVWALAPLQELMLAHALAEQDSQLMVEQFRCSIIGPLDADLLRQAWTLVVARHALLRSAPAWQGLKKPVQVVRRAIEMPWQQLDWRDLPQDERLARRDALLAETRRAGLDLTKPPLMRLQLVQMAEQEWFFAWTCHHFVLDGWSVGIVLREVFQFYEQLRQGRTPTPEPCGSFGDYVKWLASQDAGEAERFWCEQLAGRSPAPQIPLPEQPARRTPADVQQGESQVRMNASESSRFQEMAISQHVSQSVLVQAAWSVLLARYADVDEVVFGVTVSGRPSQVPDVDTIVGPFVNNVPVRVPIALEDTLPELFARLQSAQVAAHPFEHCSSQQIARAAELPDGRLYDSLVVFENYPLHSIEQWRAADVVVRDVHGTATSNYPLTLIVNPGREILLRLLYDAERYSAATAVQVLEQTATVLQAIITRADSRVCDLGLAKASRQTLPVDGEPALRILDAAGQSTPVDMPGILWVEDAEQSGSPQWRLTGYRAAWQADGQIEFLGPSESRVDSTPCPRIGRYAVDPREVEAVLRLHPLVERAAVTCSADRERGTRLAVFFVPRPTSQIAIAPGDHALVVNELRRYLVERVPAAMIPTAWRSMDALPLDASGTVDITALPAPARTRGDMSHAYVPPRDALEARVATIWSQVLGVEPIGVTDGFLELGGYSSLAVALIARLEEEFGRRLPLAALAEEPTVAHLSQLLRNASSRDENASLVPIRPHGTQLPLFCVHPAGGTVFCYNELAQHLSADVPLYGLQAQGVDGTLAPHDTIEAMAAHYIQVMKSVQGAGPYRICGWSTGGLVAFEMARQLQISGDEVSLVALIDAAIPGPDRVLDENDLVPMLQMMFPGDDAGQLQDLRTRPLAEQVEYFRTRAEGARLLLAGAGAGGARSVFDVFEANMKAVAAFRPQPLDAKITLIRASQQATPMHADPLLGWGSWAAGGTVVYELPDSTHLTMLQPPVVGQLAAMLDRWLTAAAPEQAIAEECCAGS
jgi:thioesterase domain-containing protein/acyl carrier protein